MNLLIQQFLQLAEFGISYIQYIGGQNRGGAGICHHKLNELKI